MWLWNSKIIKKNKSENQWVSGVTTIWLMQSKTSPSHRVHEVVNIGRWNVGGMSSSVCVAGYWQVLVHAITNPDPGHPKHHQWVACPVSMLVMQELGFFLFPRTVYRSLSHMAVHHPAATVAQQWASESPHGMSSITDAWSYYYLTTTMGHLIHNIDIRKPFNPHDTTHTCHLPWTGIPPWREQLLQHARLGHWAFTHSSCLWQQSVVRLRPQ